MNNMVLIILSLIVGFLLGLFFFGGLWWTTRKGILSKTPAVWFVGSLLIRLSITLGGIYIISRDHWERMLICLLGFIIARTLVTKLTQVPEIKQNQQQGG
jgi:F1F0 ATPase subunit 2